MANDEALQAFHDEGLLQHLATDGGRTQNDVSAEDQVFAELGAWAKGSELMDDELLG
jgi:hypothetical protein